MRIIPKYRHDFESIADARAFMVNREVHDFDVVAGDSGFGFAGDMVRIGARAYPISESFLQAFAGFVSPKIPIRFARDVPADLFETIGTRLLRTEKVKGTHFQVRVEAWRDPQTQMQTRIVAQAIVSDRYRWLNHERVLDEALAVTDKGQVTLTDLMLRVRAQTEQFMVQPWDNMANVSTDDLHSVGFEILNSETRNLAISVAPYVLRLVCTNGLVVAEKNLAQIWKQKHMVDPDSALRTVREIINDPERWEEVAEIYADNAEAMSRMLLRDAQGQTDIRDVALDLEAQIGRKRWLVIWEDLQSQKPRVALTRWDLLNAITRYAQDQAPDMRRGLEAYAGIYMAASLQEA